MSTSGVLAWLRTKKWLAGVRYPRRVSSRVSWLMPWSMKMSAGTALSWNRADCAVASLPAASAAAAAAPVARNCRRSTPGASAIGGLAAARGAEHPSRQGPGVLAVVEHGLAAHHHVVHALGALHPARGAVRAVAGDLVFLHPDRGQVEDHEVCHHALAHQAPIGETHDARGL